MNGALILLLGGAAGIAVLGVVVVLAAFARHQQVSWAVQAFALGNRWVYRTRDAELAGRWQHLPLDELGAHPIDIVEGEYHGIPFTWFAMASGRRDHPGDVWRHVSAGGVVALRTPSHVPWFVVAPVGFVEDLNPVDGELVDTGDERFDARWRVDGDESSARAILISEVRAWLMDSHNEGTFGFDGGDVVAWSVERIKPQHIEFYLGQLEELSSLIPAAVWEQAQGPERPTVL